MTRKNILCVSAPLREEETFLDKYIPGYDIPTGNNGRVNFSSAYTALPATHVFKGMRLVLQNGTIDLAGLAISFGLNLVYLLLGGLYFGWMLGKVGERGYLSRVQLE